MPVSPIRDDIARHARPLIDMLERRIRADFGFEVQVGMEKEAWIDYDSSSPLKGTDRDKKFAEHVGTDIAGRHARLARTLNPRIRPVGDRFYKETRDGQFEFTTRPAAPLRAVLRMDAQAQALEQKGKSAYEIPGTGDGEERYRFSSVDYNPSKGGANISGLHVNVSLWENGQNITDRRRYGPKTLGKYDNRIIERLCKYAATDTLLIAPSEQALARLRYRRDKGLLQTRTADTRYDSCTLQGQKRDEDRLEFREPSSDARHDLAVLMVLGAVYAGLADTGRPYISAKHALPLTVQNALAGFRDSGTFLDDLTEIAGKDWKMRSHIEKLRGAVEEAALTGHLAQPVLPGKSRGSPARA